MQLLDIIERNETAIITASAALFGVLLTAIVNLFQKWLEMQHAKNMKKIDFAIDFEKKQLLEPVLSFLDSDLSAMRDVYTLIFVDKKDRSSVKVESQYLSQLPAVQARVKGLGDEVLYNKFCEFSRKRLKIGNAIENPTKDPYEELESAIDIAGELMGLLFKRAENIKS
jgi:hypothetical protein